MAKDEKNQAVKGANGGTTEANGTKAAEPVVPSVTPAELKALFRKYEDADKEVTKGRQALDKLTGVRNAIVEEIALKAGKGPFKLANGKVLTATQREGTWFFRSPQPKDVVEVG